jgi:hypothetical protein
VRSITVETLTPTDDQKTQIRTLLAEGELSPDEIAGKLGVSAGVFGLMDGGVVDEMDGGVADDVAPIETAQATFGLERDHRTLCGPILTELIVSRPMSTIELPATWLRLMSV